jgi:hypothetical protein
MIHPPHTISRHLRGVVEPEVASVGTWTLID